MNMDRLHEFGIRRNGNPIAHVAEITRYVEAGSVVFGLEPRQLDASIVTNHLLNNADAYENLEAALAQVAEMDYHLAGVSIHVFDAAERGEYLRFDAFPEDPHYHYVTPDSHHVKILFDDVAEPDFLGWVMGRLATRLGPMLEHAGAAPAVVASLDPALVTAALAD